MIMVTELKTGARRVVEKTTGGMISARGITRIAGIDGAESISEIEIGSKVPIGRSGGRVTIGMSTKKGAIARTTKAGGSTETVKWTGGETAEEVVGTKVV